MKRLSVILISIGLIAVCGCINEKTKMDKHLSFSLKEIGNLSELKLSDIDIVDIQYIPLETNDNALIPFIMSVDFYDESFYINTGKTLFRFDKQGNYLGQIGKQGRGPTEYQFINDLDINETNGQVYIATGMQNKFYIYSAENGSFIETIPAPDKVIKFRIVGNQILSYTVNHHGNIEYSFNILGFDGQNIRRFPNKYNFEMKHLNIFLTENLFYNFNNHIFIKELNSDTVFTFVNNEFTPSYILDHGEKLMPANIKGTSDMRYIKENFYVQRNLFEFGDKVYFEFSYNFDQYIFIADKNSNKHLWSKQEKGLINDIDAGPIVPFKSTLNSHTIISWTSALDLKQHVESVFFKTSTPKKPQYKVKLEELSRNLKENDNPVLILFKIRN